MRIKNNKFKDKNIYISSSFLAIYNNFYKIFLESQKNMFQI